MTTQRLALPSVTQVITAVLALISFFIVLLWLESDLVPTTPILLALFAGFYGRSTLKLAWNWLKPKEAAVSHLSHLYCQQYPSLRFFSGHAIDFQMYFDADGDAALKETIIHAAFVHANGLIYSVGRPGRHHHLMALLDEYNLAGSRGQVVSQGFITSYGRYVDREVGVAVARAADQLIREPSPSDELTSEDVWEGPEPGAHYMRDAYAIFVKAQILIASAEVLGFVLETECIPDYPPCMGGFTIVPHIREDAASSYRKPKED
jgi:hypothetical protein